MTIYWNKNASLFCSTEKGSVSQTPALGGGHELAHAHSYLIDKDNYMSLANRADEQYGTKEEARVITLIEHHAAKTLNECTRNSHSGKYILVNGPLQTGTILDTPK